MRRRQQLAQQFESFRRPSSPNRVTPVRLPPGWLRLATRPKLDRVPGRFKNDRNRRGCRLCGQRRDAPVATITATCGGPDRQPSPAADRPGPPPNGIRSLRFGPRRSRLPQPRRNAVTRYVTSSSRFDAEKADHRHRCLLRARRKRPRCRRAANKRDELTPSHVLSSSRG